MEHFLEGDAHALGDCCSRLDNFADVRHFYIQVIARAGLENR